MSDTEAPLTIAIQRAIHHRLKWASLHWRTEVVPGEAWAHIADSVAAQLQPWLAAHDVEVRAEAASYADRLADSETERLQWDGAPGMLGNWIGGIRVAAQEIRDKVAQP